MTQEELGTLLGSGLGIALMLFALLWTVLWIAVPFLVYFIWHRLKRHHEDTYAQLAETNRLLKRLAGERGIVESEPKDRFGLGR